jgi:hypothetical protein
MYVCMYIYAHVCARACVYYKIFKIYKNASQIHYVISKTDCSKQSLLKSIFFTFNIDTFIGLNCTRNVPINKNKTNKYQFCSEEIKLM